MALLLRLRILFIVMSIHIFTAAFCSGENLDDVADDILKESDSLENFELSDLEQNSLEAILNEEAQNRPDPPIVGGAPTCPLPADCEEYRLLGYRKSAAYRIWPRSRILQEKPIDVYCDMETDNGGWTVIQRRGDFDRPADFFNKPWDEYKRGFGDIEKDFWLGNDNIFALTNQKQYSVRFEMTDYNGNDSYALYDQFVVQDEAHKYNLSTIQGYSGTAGDSMVDHVGMYFSTFDRDNDRHERNCAQSFKSGWWFDACFTANLNGIYCKGKQAYPLGIIWSTWKGFDEPLHEAEIKIRSANFRRTWAYYNDA